MKEFFEVSGKLSWVKHLKPDEKYGKWSFRLHPDAKSLEFLRDLQTASKGISGIKNVLGKDEDGYYMQFSRQCKKEMRGQMVYFEPPRVVNEEGLPVTEAVGNGSDGIATIELYTHNTPGGGRSKAVRWESLKVINLIPYVAPVQEPTVEGALPKPKF